MKRNLSSVIPAGLIVLMPVVAFAHPGHDLGAHHLASGFLHPFTGLDHILAMAAVGMWSAQFGRARWAVPLGFLAMMLAGALLAFVGVRLPFVESAILASVLVMGLALLWSLRLPVGAAVALAGFFALFHGYAHLAEMPASTSAAVYAGGFILASGILLTAGAALGYYLTAIRQTRWLRACGGAVAAAAFLIAFA